MLFHFSSRVSTNLRGVWGRGLRDWVKADRLFAVCFRFGRKPSRVVAAVVVLNLKRCSEATGYVYVCIA